MRLAALLTAVMLVVPAFPGGFAAMSSGKVSAAEGDGGLSDHVIDTVSPNHVRFNLFDYWVDTRDSRYNENWDLQKGINEGHVFLFGAGEGRGPWNVWTGNEKHYNNNQDRTSGVRYGQYQGTAAAILADGYPALDLEDDVADVLKGSPAFIEEYGLEGKLTESLAYLFDPDVENEYKASYENVQGLVKYDGNGGYVYNSHENYAAFKETSGVLGTNGEPSDGYFEVYDSWGLTSRGSSNGQFFPFDGADEVFEMDAKGNYAVDETAGRLIPRHDVPLDGDTPLNHYSGMTMETVFLQPESGMIDAETPMYFTFSGDDDVWIYIDDVLVSDLGGIHDECFTIIDFETGTVYTGLTPMIKNDDGTFSEDMPELEELRAAETDGTADATWQWCDRASAEKSNVTGTYEEYKQVHGIEITTLKEIFDNAGCSGLQSWGDGTTMSEGTFDQNTQHELKMFYLERGAGASNLILSFNMLAVPASGITKTDQDGNPVPGAQFELWPAKVNKTEKDEYGNAAPLIDSETGLYIADDSDPENLICTAVTDQNGQLNFVTDTKKIISFQERAQSSSDPQFYYVLKEIGRPAGYRSNGDISLYYSIYNNQSKEGVLLSYNYWQTGAYAQAVLDVTMTDRLYEYGLTLDGSPIAGSRIAPSETADEDEIQDYLDNGILFAVPVKRMDMDGSIYDESNLHALYGTTNTGWTVMAKSIEDKASVLEAAKNMARVMQETRQSGSIIAERNASQLFQVTVTNMPGQVQLSYPYLMGTGREDDSEYNIAFYFAPNASSLDGVTDADSIVRIASVTQADASGNEDRFERRYASRFYIANMFNRVRVQKLNYYGERLPGTEFAMFQTYSGQDRDGDGSRYVWDERRGMYRNSAVVNDDGTLKTRGEILETEAWDRGITASEGSSGVPGALEIDGTLTFPSKFDEYLSHAASEPYRVDSSDTSTYMEEGEYVIFETAAPEGYEANETPIKVMVNDSGVFADAGETEDGVRVGQFPGYVMNPLTTFASEGAVDESLTFIDTTLKVFGPDGTLQTPIEGDITWMYKYSNENDRYIFFAENVGSYVTSGRNLFQFTDAGTPSLIATQNNDVTAKAIIFDGKYKRYNGTVTVNKKNGDNSIYSLQGTATDGTIGFWLQKASGEDSGQTLDSVYIGGKALTEGTDYHVFGPKVADLSAHENLSGLLSVETLVQVFDQGYGTLSVTKETENTPDGSAAEDEIFHFRVYSVFENATELIIAKTDAAGKILTDAETGYPISADFTGTLNVRLGQQESTLSFDQDTVTNIAVDFENGVGMLYLQPDYDVEYVYIPQNRDHPIYSRIDPGCGVIGLVKTDITLTDPGQSGEGTVHAVHMAFADRKMTYTVPFTDGAGRVYRMPDYVIQSVSFEGGVSYKADAADGENGLTADNRIQRTALEEILGVPVRREVDVSFTERDGTASTAGRIVTNSELPPEDGDFDSVTVGDGDVTVYGDGDGYKMAYRLSSDTNGKAIVAQFALHSGQTVTVEVLPAGETYYIYEYAVGEDGGRDLGDWDTVITPGDGGQDLTDGYGYRAAVGTIPLDDGTAAEQHVTFTNSAHVGQLTVSKAVSGDQADDTDREREFVFTVTLKDRDGNPLKGTYPYTGSAEVGAAVPADGTLTLDADGSAQFRLKHGQSITIQEIPKGAAYEVKEADSEGYTVVLDADEDADGAAEGTIAKGETASAAFTNLKLSTLRFTKVSAEDHSHPLAGAEFELYRLVCRKPGHDHSEDLIDRKSDCWKLVKTQISGEDGSVVFGGLQADSEYRLAETKAPDGRALPEGQWKITTDENNLIEIEAIGARDGRLPTAFAADVQTGALLLPNAAPMAIPSSGGYGALPFQIAGGLMMLTAAAVIIAKKLRGKPGLLNKR